LELPSACMERVAGWTTCSSSTLAQCEARGHLPEGIRQPASVGGGTGGVV
jgi:hypothetical protein